MELSQGLPCCNCGVALWTQLCGGYRPKDLPVYFRPRLRLQHLQGQERKELAGLDKCLVAEIPSHTHSLVLRIVKIKIIPTNPYITLTIQSILHILTHLKLITSHSMRKIVF